MTLCMHDPIHLNRGQQWLDMPVRTLRVWFLPFPLPFFSFFFVGGEVYFLGKEQLSSILGL